MPLYAVITRNKLKENLKKITLGGGCFWCTEAVFQRLKGVSHVESGYMGGQLPNPTYRDICTGNTGHAEIIQITYDPEIISLEQILEIFWTAHDPTTLNRQGADKGTQYRSVIFYESEEEKEIAEKSIKEVASQLYSDPIVTELAPLTTYYPGEAYHQNYYNGQSSKPYCHVIITPKISKLRSKYAPLIKEEYL